MSEFLLPAPSRRRRADAARSSAVVLDAACRVWSTRPEASVEEIAAAAGVTRQTVYAHYASREALLGAAMERAKGDIVAAIDAAFGTDPPATALRRLLRTSWQILARYPFLHHGAKAHGSHQAAHEEHEPVLERLLRLIVRGQEAGDFDRRVSPTWLLAALIGLQHIAYEEVAAGRLTVEEAGSALEHSTLRVFGVDSAASADCPRSPTTL